MIDGARRNGADGATGARFSMLIATLLSKAAVRQCPAKAGRGASRQPGIPQKGAAPAGVVSAGAAISPLGARDMFVDFA
jgi:hypothetical protein